MIDGISNKKEEGMNVLTSDMEGIKAYITNTSKNAVPVEVVSLSSSMTDGADSLFGKVPFFSETKNLLTSIDSNIESLNSIFEIQSRDIILNPTPENISKAKTLSSAIPMGFLMLHEDLSKLIGEREESNELKEALLSSSSSGTGFNLKNAAGTLGTALAASYVIAQATETITKAIASGVNLFTDEDVKKAFAGKQAAILEAEAQREVDLILNHDWTVEDVLSGNTSIDQVLDTFMDAGERGVQEIAKAKALLTNSSLQKVLAGAEVFARAGTTVANAAREALNLFNDEEVKKAFAEAQARIITAEAERTILQIENGLVSAHDMENAVDKGLSLAGEIMLGIQTGGISFMIDGAINLLSKWAEKGAETVANIQTMFTDEVKKASAEGQARVIQAEYTAMAKAYESEIIQNAMVASLVKEMTVEETLSTPFQAINGIIKGIGSTWNTLKEVATGSEEKSQTQAVDFVDKIYGISNNEISSILDTFEFNPEDSNSIREQIVLSTKDTLDKYLGLVRDNLDLDVSIESNREQRSLQLDTLEDNILKVMGTAINSAESLGIDITNTLNESFGIDTQELYSPAATLNDIVGSYLTTAKNSLNTEFRSFNGFSSAQMGVLNDTLVNTLSNSISESTVNLESQNQFSIGSRTPSDDPLLMSSWRLEEQTRAIFEYMKVINDSLSTNVGRMGNVNIFNNSSSEYVEEPGV